MSNTTPPNGSLKLVAATFRLLHLLRIKFFALKEDLNVEVVVLICIAYI